VPDPKGQKTCLAEKPRSRCSAQSIVAAVSTGGGSHQDDRIGVLPLQRLSCPGDPGGHGRELQGIGEGRFCRTPLKLVAILRSAKKIGELNLGLCESLD
jgi:hypothetical protein